MFINAHLSMLTFANNVKNKVKDISEVKNILIIVLSSKLRDIM